MPDDKEDTKNRSLIGVPLSSYPNSQLHAEHILEQYKLYAKLLDTHSNRFDSLNKFFLTLHLAVISGLLLIIKENIDISILGYLSLISLPSLICFVWWVALKSSRHYTTIKYEILEEMEELLPTRPFNYEWYNKMKSGNIYLRIQVTLQWIPWFIIVLYVVLGFVMVSRVN